MIQTGIYRPILQKIIADFKASKLSFSEINELSDKDLEDLFKKPPENVLSEKLKTLYGLFPEIDRELKRKGVTKKLLWEEYKRKYPDGASSSAFLFHFSQWKARKTPIMRQNHKAGDKLFIDFAGEKLTVTDKETRQGKPVEVFVAVLGASQYTYVEAVFSQKKEDFITACENALHFFGGVPAAIVPDNLRAAVTKSDKYEQTINETFADFAEYYSTTILPARAYRPTDKALLANDSGMQGFYNSTINKTIGQMNEYESILTALTSKSVLTDSTLYKRTLNRLNETLSEVTATNIAEENFVTVSNIYIKRLNDPKETLTFEERKTLATLAIQCPYIAGDAVYAARALLSQVDPYWHFDDMELCNTPKNTARPKPIAIDSNAHQYIKVYPNPTGSQLNVIYSANTVGQVKFEIINSMGQTVKLMLLQQGVNSATFDVSNLANGIYHWSLRDSVRIIASGKESIVR